MANRVTVTFEITGWEEHVYDEPPDAPPLSRATVKKRFHGDVEGESTAELLTCVGEGGAGYVAIERFVGRVQGRSGGFVIQHGGLQSGDAQRPVGHIVPASGTGELAGIRGDATFSHDEHGARLTLEYQVA